jgi:hypothetical protein
VSAKKFSAASDEFSGARNSSLPTHRPISSVLVDGTFTDLAILGIRKLS